MTFESDAASPDETETIRPRHYTLNRLVSKLYFVAIEGMKFWLLLQGTLITFNIFWPEAGFSKKKNTHFTYIINSPCLYDCHEECARAKKSCPESNTQSNTVSILERLYF
jgi:hypothetical protein